MEFLSTFEELCGSQASVARLRNHPSYVIFINKWNLPVYFQMRYHFIKICKTNVDDGHTCFIFISDSRRSQEHLKRLCVCHLCPKGMMLNQVFFSIAARPSQFPFCDVGMQEYTFLPWFIGTCFILHMVIHC